MGESDNPVAPASVTLRPVRPDDDPFLREVYACTRAEELAGVGLDAAQQRTFTDMQFNAQRADYLRRFPDAQHSVVLCAGQPIGRLYVVRSADEVRILDVTILPDHRSCGMGTGLIRTLLAEASRTTKPVRIYLTNDSRSVGLFERLGFLPSKQEDLISEFEWRPSA